MDDLDRRIIGELQRDARISLTDLAERLPLSLSATSERFRRLVKSGVLTGFEAVVDPAAVGRTVEALIDVRLKPGAYSPTMDLDLPQLAGIVEAIHVTGRFDLQLRVVTRDVPELDQLLATLIGSVGAEETNTRLILRSQDGFPRPLPLT